MSNLYKKLDTSGSNPFVSSGFEGNTFNIPSIFNLTNTPFVDISKGIHTFACATTNGSFGGDTGGKGSGEFEKLYYSITGINAPISNFWNKQSAFYSVTLGLNSSSKSADLLFNGMKYYLGGANYDQNCAWYITENGGAFRTDEVPLGIRIVFSLYQGLVTNNFYDGVGNDIYTAYEIKKMK